MLAYSIIASVACTPVPGSGEDAGLTLIYRDTWGVPHIYAPTAVDGLYAMGWAQAEDRPEQLLQNLLLAMGEGASVLGEGALQSDLRARTWDHYGNAQRSFGQFRLEARQHLEAFTRGINAFYDEHPKDLPSWWGNREVEPTMLVAWARFFLYDWSIDEVYGDLQRGGIQAGFEASPRASNQFAVSPSRSSEGAAILAIDPHLSWFGPSRFWEFRIHAGQLHASGVTLPGFAYVGLGHNGHVAWAMTTGGPDTADVYELTLNPEDQTRYLYDGTWQTLTSRQVTIKVRDAPAQHHTIWASHHGPILATRAGKAYAGRMAYDEEVDIIEPWYELSFAKDYRGAVRAMATLAMFPQNVMVADTSGNIYYQRTGRTPRRAEGFDWSAPVNGSSSTTEWQGFHAASEHLQVLNPPQGYMQNCNIPPDAMMVGSPFALGSIPSYLYGSLAYGQRSGWINQRGARAVELLEADRSITAQEAIAYINDVRPYGVDRWLELLRRATQGADTGDTTLAFDTVLSPALEEIFSWDGKLAASSSAALKYAYWRRQMVEDHGADWARELAATVDDHYSVVLGEQPRPIAASAVQLHGALTSYVSALKRIVLEHGSANILYGDAFRVGRDELSWPVGGGRDLGSSTLRTISYGDERDDYTRWGRSGQTSTQVVVLSRPIRSWSYLPIGQSDRPDSPHYTDQAEQLFSPRQLKPSWWLPEELVGHIESRTTLEIAPAPDIDLQRH